MGLFTDPAYSGWFTEFFLLVVARHLEIIAVLTAIIYLFYSIKADKMLWFYGFISSCIFVYICYNAGIYAETAINLYYVIISIYGWIHWTVFKGTKAKEIPYSKIKSHEILITLVITVFLYGLIFYVLKNYTDSKVPILDSLTTALSITATWLLARKIIENWLLWIVTDALLIGLFYYKGLYLASFLNLVYTIMAVSGYLTWKRKWKLQQKI